VPEARDHTGHSGNIAASLAHGINTAQYDIVDCAGVECVAFP
jgi:hypothetical protein